MKKIVLLLILISITVSCTETIGNTDRTQAAITSLTSDQMTTSTVFKTQRSAFEDSIKTLLEKIAVLDKHPAILLRKYNYTFHDYFPENEVVIETAYRRYSLYYNYTLKELSLWVRPKGTVSRAVLTNIVDMSIDGTVDFAIESNTTPKLMFSSEAMFGEDKRGEQHESYWHIRYKNAIDSIAQHLAIAL